MSLFENILSKTKSVVDMVGDKAGHFIDISKMNMNLSELKSIRKNKFEKLGEEFYLSKSGNGEKEFDYLKIFSEIEELNKNIDKLIMEIAKTKNKLVCKKCGKNNAKDAQYCCQCGECLKKDDRCTCESCCSEEKTKSDSEDSELNTEKEN